jgi:hypothetical protein
MHPIQILLQIRERRSRVSRFWLPVAFLVPFVTLQLLDPRSIKIFLGTLAALLALALMPLFWFGKVGATLSSLRTGRALEEVLACGSEGLLDSLIVGALRSLALQVGPPLVMLGLGTLASAGAFHLSVSLNPGLLLIVPALWLGAYPVALWTLWSDDDPRSNRGQWRRVVAMVPVLQLAALLHPLAWVGLLAWIAWTRSSAIRALKRLSCGEPPAEPKTSSHRQLWTAWNEHPLVIREMAREANLPLGRLGLTGRLLLQFLPALAVLPLLGHPDARLPWLLVYGCSLWMLCGLRSLGLVNRERSQQTWEVLRSTRLSGPEIVRDLIQVSIVPRRWWFLSGLMLTLAVASETGFCLLGLALCWWMGWLGATFGVLTGLQSESTTQARAQFYLGSLGLLGLTAIIYGGVACLLTASGSVYGSFSGWLFLLPLVPIFGWLSFRYRRQINRSLRFEGTGTVRPPANAWAIVIGASLLSALSIVDFSAPAGPVAYYGFEVAAVWLCSVALLHWFWGWVGWTSRNKMAWYAVTGAACGALVALLPQLDDLRWAATGFSPGCALPFHNPGPLPLLAGAQGGLLGGWLSRPSAGAIPVAQACLKASLFCALLGGAVALPHLLYDQSDEGLENRPWYRRAQLCAQAGRDTPASEITASDYFTRKQVLDVIGQRDPVLGWAHYYSLLTEGALDLAAASRWRGSRSLLMHGLTAVAVRGHQQFAFGLGLCEQLLLSLHDHPPSVAEAVSLRDKLSGAHLRSDLPQTKAAVQAWNLLEGLEEYASGTPIYGGPESRQPFARIWARGQRELVLRIIDERKKPDPPWPTRFQMAWVNDSFEGVAPETQAIFHRLQNDVELLQHLLGLAAGSEVEWPAQHQLRNGSLITVHNHHYWEYYGRPGARLVYPPL